MSQEQLGGASVHAAKSGVAHFVSENEEEGIATLRKLLGFLPSNNMEDAPAVDCTDAIDRLDDVLNDIIPDNPNKPYNVLDVIRGVVDNGDFLESQPKFAPNIVTGFARFNGQSVGIIANQPKFLAGVLDINASRKAARFVRFCDAFNIPIVTFVDVPASCRAPLRNTAASSSTAPSCCSLTAKRPFRRSRSFCAKPTAAPTA